VHKDKTGRVKAIEYLKAEMVPDERGGCPKPVATEGSNTIIEATSVMVAIGQMGDYSFLEKEFEDKIERCTSWLSASAMPVALPLFPTRCDVP